MKGIYFQKEFQRFYPDNEIAAQVLGYVGVDDNGLGGLEEKFDSALHGRSGLMYTAMDARRKVLGSSEHDPEPGRNLVLTIDENIQFMAERALDHAMEKTQAVNGTVVVQDVHTGQILALAIRPTFNPNQFRHTTPALLRDHAVSDVYEPGSTFKLVTYSAAMDSKVATPDDMIDCQGGKITIFGRIIHDDKANTIGVIPVHKALEESSDVAAVKLALKVGPDKLLSIYSRLRLRHALWRGAARRNARPAPPRQPLAAFLHRLHRHRPGGRASRRCNWSPWFPPSPTAASICRRTSSCPTRPTPATTSDQKSAPPQVAQVPQARCNATANRSAQSAPGGRASRHLHAGRGPDAQDDGGRGALRHRQSRRSSTATPPAAKPAPRKKSIPPRTSIRRPCTSPRSRASRRSTIRSSPSPWSSIRPRATYYGTAVSAPVFAEVAQQVLEYLGVPHDIDLRPATTASKKRPPVTEDDSSRRRAKTFRRSTTPPTICPATIRCAPRLSQSAAQQFRRTATANSAANPKSAHSSAAPASLATFSNRLRQTSRPLPIRSSSPSAGQLRVPSLIGLPVRKVIEQAGAAGLEVVITGNGIVREQAPAPGTMVPPGTKIVVRCER